MEEDIIHFTAGMEPAHIFAFNIAGVALREEFCKLLLFLPLLPSLIRRDKEMDALIIASFVGLGFAIEENCGYFMMSEATGGPGRFLTANFFHIALTGLNGLALFRAFTRGATGLNDFLFIFPITILAHGAYDALLDLPSSEGGGYLATGVYAGFAMFYFKRVHPLRRNVRMTLGLTGAFVIGCSIMAATVIAYVMIDLGPGDGLAAIAPQMISTAILLFLFFREFDEQLA
jgi:RsiW-degrading membrane proteinase PrsW (M82 family)